MVISSCNLKDILGLVWLPCLKVVPINSSSPIFYENRCENNSCYKLAAIPSAKMIFGKLKQAKLCTGFMII